MCVFICFCKAARVCFGHFEAEAALETLHLYCQNKLKKTEESYANISSLGNSTLYLMSVVYVSTSGQNGCDVDFSQHRETSDKS